MHSAIPWYAALWFVSIILLITKGLLTSLQVYYTILQNESQKARVPVRQGNISTCELCSEEHVVACNSTTCMDDYYHAPNATVCLPCNQSTCDARPGMYRSLDHVFIYVCSASCERGAQNPVRGRSVLRQLLCNVRPTAPIQ